MASTFKTLLPSDMANTTTMLYEQIPLTGTIFSGTYSSSAGEGNILYYSHDMFQSVYDYPYLSSSANSLFDLTFGVNKNSEVYFKSETVDKSKKLNVYNQLAKISYGCDTTGSIKAFDRDGNPDTSTDFLNDGYFITFSRLLVKDEIKKGTFKLKLGLGGTDANKFALTGTIYDHSGTLTPIQYKSNSPSGEYGILYLSESISDTSNFPVGQTDKSVGLIFYQTGLVFLSTNVFALSGASSPSTNLANCNIGQLGGTAPAFVSNGTTYTTIREAAVTGSIDELGNALRRRIINIDFQNTTELNSTIYFLRVNNNEFNYSANPTYLSSSSEIRVKGGFASNSPVSYITTAGLYSPDNELLAVAKLSQPLKKTEEQSMILRVRLDY